MSYIMERPSEQLCLYMKDYHKIKEIRVNEKYVDTLFKPVILASKDEINNMMELVKQEKEQFVADGYKGTYVGLQVVLDNEVDKFKIIYK